MTYAVRPIKCCAICTKRVPVFDSACATMKVNGDVFGFFWLCIQCQEETVHDRTERTSNVRAVEDGKRW